MIKRFDEFKMNELSSTIVKNEQSAKERFDYHSKNIDGFMKEIKAGVDKMRKEQKGRGDEDWTQVGSIAEVASQLNDLNNFINGKEEEYL